jgi:hypothetical protein
LGAKQHDGGYLEGLRTYLQRAFAWQTRSTSRDWIPFALIFHRVHRFSMANALICPDAFLSPLEIDAVVTRALKEDLGRAGDVTSTATIPEHMTARASVAPSPACRFLRLVLQSFLQTSGSMHAYATVQQSSPRQC